MAPQAASSAARAATLPRATSAPITPSSTATQAAGSRIASTAAKATATSGSRTAFAPEQVSTVTVGRKDAPHLVPVGKTGPAAAKASASSSTSSAVAGTTVETTPTSTTTAAGRFIRIKGAFLSPVTLTAFFATGRVKEVLIASSDSGTPVAQAPSPPRTALEKEAEASSLCSVAITPTVRLRSPDRSTPSYAGRPTTARTIIPYARARRTTSPKVLSPVPVGV